MENKHVLTYYLKVAGCIYSSYKAYYFVRLCVYRRDSVTPPSHVQVVSSSLQSDIETQPLDDISPQDDLDISIVRDSQEDLANEVQYMCNRL